MKKTDIEKTKALKLVGRMKQGGVANRFPSDASAPVIDRREQRKLDQAQGLVSFPVKIKQTLVDEIRKRAIAQNLGTNDIIGELLEQALKNADADANLG